MILGIKLTMLIGPGVPIPAPLPLTDAVSSIQVRHSDSGHSGFSITFSVGRSGPADLLDYDLLLNPLLQPMSRVILMVIFNVTPRVIFDGFITERTLAPSEEPGRSTLTVTGEDVSVMMDLIELKMPHPAQDETTIAFITLGEYAALLLSPPITIPPNSVYFPPPTDEIPAQHGTDRQYLEQLAGRYGFVFFVMPGAFPGQNFAYWGPPPRLATPQRALSVNMGPFSNVESISFQQHGLAPVAVIDLALGPRNIPLPIVAPLPLLVPPLAAMPLIPFRTALSDTDRISGGDSAVGLSYVRALARAQARVDRSYQDAVTASGSVDALQYGEILLARSIVALRGAGFSHDGLWYVKSVNHDIARGSYKQSFSLAREGIGSLLPVVTP